MAKTTTIFWVDIVLLALLAATILSVTTEIFTHAFIHVIFGVLLSGGALLHIMLHWNWIKNAFERYNRLPTQARTNAHPVWMHRPDRQGDVHHFTASRFAGCGACTPGVSGHHFTSDPHSPPLEMAHDNNAQDDCTMRCHLLLPDHTVRWFDC